MTHQAYNKAHCRLPKPAFKTLLLLCLALAGCQASFAQSGSYFGVYNGYFLNGSSLSLTGTGPTELLANVDDLFHPYVPATVSTNMSQPPSNGTATVSADGHVVSYVPDGGFVGVDSLVFDVCDATTGTCHDAVCYFQIFDESGLLTDWLELGVPTVLPDSWSRLIIMLEGSSSGSGFTTEIEGLAAALGVGEETASGNIVYLPGGTPSPDVLAVEFCTYNPVILFPICDTLPINIGFGGMADIIAPADDYFTTTTSLPATIDVLDNDTYSGSIEAMTITTPPTNGTAQLTAAGSIMYTPDPAFMGTDSLVYEICDGFGSCGQATVYIEVTDEPAPPVDATDDYVQATGPAFAFNVLANDSGDALGLTGLCSPPAFGTVTYTPDGTMTYAYNTGAILNDQFCYTVCSATTGECDTAIVYIAPTWIDAIDDMAVTFVATPVTLPVLANDYNYSSGYIEVTNIATPPANGTVQITAGDVITYTPNPGFVGMDFFVYEICDDFGNCGQATVSVEVLGSSISAEDDQATTTASQAVAVEVLENDTYFGATGLTVVLAMPPANGTAQVTASGMVMYTPNPGFWGTDVFTYEVCDGLGTCDEAAVFITVQEPVTGSGYYYGVYNAYFFGDQLLSLTDVSVPNDLTLLTTDLFHPNIPSVVSTAITMPPNHGAATVSGDGGSINYVPGIGVGVEVDSLAFSVCDAATGVCHDAICYIQFYEFDISLLSGFASNGFPTLLPDSWDALFPFCGAGTEPATANNMDVDSLTASYGMAEVMPSGNIIYLPDSPGPTTPDVLGIHYTSLSPTIFMPYAEIPVNIGFANNTGSSIEATDDYVQATGPAFAFNVLANDSGDALELTGLCSPPAFGTVTYTPDGTMTYAYNTGAILNDEFCYTVCSATTGECDTAIVYIALTIVEPNNDMAVTFVATPVTIGVLENDNHYYSGNIEITNITTPPANGTAQIATDFSITYTPNPGFVGMDFFVYEICDDFGNCGQATVSVEVMGSSISAEDDQATTTASQAVAVEVLENDTYFGATGLTVVLAMPPANGTAQVTASGMVMYTPNPGFLGMDVFTYEVCDGLGTCDEAVVFITVQEPVAGSGYYAVYNCFFIDGGFMSFTDIDPSNPIMTLLTTDLFHPNIPSVVNTTITMPPNHGVATVSGDGGSISYVPGIGVGVDSLTFSVCDATTGVCHDAICYIQFYDDTTSTINDWTANGFPTMLPDSWSVLLPFAGSGTVPDAIGIYNMTASHGIAEQVAGSGNTIYIPDNPGPTTPDVLTIAYTFDFGMAEIDINIGFTNNTGNSVEAVDDYVQATGPAFAFNVLDNDSGDSLELVALCGTPAFGTVSINPDGTMTYAYNTGAILNDEFCYTVCSATTGECTTATVYILAPCTDDCVWPGDANNDGIADNFDVLMLGLGYGLTGGARSPATTDWIGQHAPQWNDSISLLDLGSPVLVADYVNAKFADCDGNGLINDLDMGAIDANYGLTHDKTGQQAASTAPAIWFDMPDTVQAGTWVTVDVMAGTAALPFDEVYGLAFTLNYDPATVEAGSVSITPQNDWLTNDGENLAFSKDLGNGELDAALVRTDHLNASGYGPVAQATFLVIDNLDGKTEGVALTLDASDALFIKTNGEYDALKTEPASALVTHTGGNASLPDGFGAKLYPNPATDAVQLQVEGANGAKSLRLYDLQGNVVYAAKLGARENTHTIGLDGLPAGMYLLQLQSDAGSLTRKLHHLDR